MAAESLSWLPAHSSWSTATALEALPKEPDPAAWRILVKLTQYQLPPDGHDPARPPPAQALPGPTHWPVHPLRAPLRARRRHVGPPAARHPGGPPTPRLHVSILTAVCGHYMEPLPTPIPSREEVPDSVLLPLDARHITGGISPGALAVAVASHLDVLFGRLRGLWRAAQEIGSAARHQAALPIFPSLLGEAKHLMPGHPPPCRQPTTSGCGTSRPTRESWCYPSSGTPRSTAPPPGTIPRSGTARSSKSKATTPFSGDLVVGAVATKLTNQMGTIHSPHIDIVAVSKKESNYAI
jgi:hypothetical protein